MRKRRGLGFLTISCYLCGITQKHEAMKYPIGIQSFDRIITEGYVYVDKTDMIYSLVKNGSIYFLSRPRRFGKSLLVSTLEHYFLGHKELFKGLKIDALEREWLEYPVFHVDFNGDDFKQSGVLEKKIEGRIAGWEEEYGRDINALTLGDRFASVLKRAHERTGCRCVVLVDEYDKPILDALSTDFDFSGANEHLETRNRDVLRGFYSVFKAADADLQFVLLTGVTKFSQVSVFSGFNQPADISMVSDFDTLCGITQEEMELYFAEPIAELAQKYRQTIPEMRQLLKQRYDGYHFSTRMVDVYNPFSLLNVFRYKEMSDYWFSTGTPTYLVRLLNHAQEGLDEMTGRYYRRQEFVDYKATEERPLPMIYQSGYLTIKNYDWEDDTFLLDFPNNEVKAGFLAVVAANYLRAREDVASFALRLSKTLKTGDLESFRKLMTAFLSTIPYDLRRKTGERERERYFQYTFYLVLRLVSVYIVRVEEHQSQGRVDCIIETDHFVYVFEFKLDGTADAALRQIEEKGYALSYAADKRKLYKIGVNFSSETGTIDDWEVL